jgi:glycosyltransferase involved in cell wall biosynthesis
MSVGHLVSRKRHHVLIEAFARVHAFLPDARLVIVGALAFEPRYPRSLKRLAQRSAVADKVHFTGNLAPRSVVDWLRAADIFALATAREGCCNAVLEALAVGTPVVTTPAGDNPHFVKDGRNGFIVPIDDVNAMAAAIHRALSAVRWDRAAIADSLHSSVGDWSDVAKRVLAFVDRRLRETANQAVGGSGHRLGTNS